MNKEALVKRTWNVPGCVCVCSTYMVCSEILYEHVNKSEIFAKKKKKKNEIEKEMLASG